MKVYEAFIKCPNCNRFKNYNYTNKTIAVNVKCVCGTVLTKKIKLK